MLSEHVAPMNFFITQARTRTVETFLENLKKMFNNNNAFIPYGGQAPSSNNIIYNSGPYPTQPTMDPTVNYQQVSNYVYPQYPYFNYAQVPTTSNWIPNSYGS